MKRKYTINMSATGKTKIERWYLLVRQFAATLARRQKTLGRCKMCLALTVRNGEQTMRCGCGGCTEVETMLEVCKKFFSLDDEKPNGSNVAGSGTAHGRQGTATGRA